MYEKVKQLVAQVLTIDDSITMHKNLRDYGMNSIEAIKIIVIIEQEFDIEFNDEDLLISSIETIEHIMKCINKCQNQR